MNVPLSPKGRHQAIHDLRKGFAATRERANFPECQQRKVRHRASAAESMERCGIFTARAGPESRSFGA
jgi:hypothetical protein